VGKKKGGKNEPIGGKCGKDKKKYSREKRGLPLLCGIFIYPAPDYPAPGGKAEEVRQEEESTQYSREHPYSLLIRRPPIVLFFYFGLKTSGSISRLSD